MVKTWLIITFFCVAGVIPANAQDQAVAPSPAETPEPETGPDSLSISQIAIRADEINAELLRLFDLLQKPGPETGEIQADIDALASDLGSKC